MKNQTKYSKAFTLIEVLIATMIFAVVMVITTGVVGNSVKYQTKIRAVRETSGETSRLADLITSDIRSANSKIDYTAFFPLNAVFPLVFKNGVYISEYNVSMNYYEAPSGPDSSTSPWLGTELVVGFADTSGITKYRCYASYSGKVYFSQSSDLNDFQPSQLINSANVISDPNLDVSIKIGGYAPRDTAPDRQQPYVSFMIDAKTLDYANLLPTDRAQATLKSTVTVRSYNN